MVFGPVPDHLSKRERGYDEVPRCCLRLSEEALLYLLAEQIGDGSTDGDLSKQKCAIP